MPSSKRQILKYTRFTSIAESMTYVYSLSRGIGELFVAALFSKYSANIFWQESNLHVLGDQKYWADHPVWVLWPCCGWLRIWGEGGVFNPWVTYGVTLWSGVRLASLTLLWRRCPLTYYGSLSSTPHTASQLFLKSTNPCPLVRLPNCLQVVVWEPD